MASANLQLTRLRSQLQHVSSEFDNLTVAELQQMKFGLQQRIFTEIAMYSPLLRSGDLCARCAELIERGQRAAKHQGKEQRLEAERETRLRFMALVQEALGMLSWPPACEAFADVLTPLMTDKAFFVTAVEFMLSTVLPAPTLLGNDRRAESKAAASVKPVSQRKPSLPREGSPRVTAEDAVSAQSKKLVAADNSHTAPTTLHDELSQQKYDALKASFLVR